jgi:hypothetical protein
MRLIASIELALCPAKDVVCLSNGNVLVLTSGEQDAFLGVYDEYLALIQNVHLDGRALGLVLAQDGTPWIIDRVGATAFGDHGSRIARVEVRPRPGMHVAAAQLIDSDIVFALEHDRGAPMPTPILERVSNEGRVRWSTTLPIEGIAYKGLVEMRADKEWRPQAKAPWIPKRWRAKWSALKISGDAILTCFDEMPGSGIGFGYVLSLDDGSLRFTTKTGPISEVAPLGDGSFLVGYQGYGAFETLRYTRDGSVDDHWATHGYYLVAPDDVRVIEMENTLPSTMHLARLTAGGAVTRGVWLDGYYTSPPYLHTDGTAFFFRNGAFCAARDVVIKERLEICAPENKTIATSIAVRNERAYFAFCLWGTATPAPRLVRIDLVSPPA